MGKKYKIVYNKAKCIGATLCADIAPDYWRMEGDLATLVPEGAIKNDGQEELTFDEKDLAINLEAAEACPVAVITILDLESGQQIYPKAD